MHRKKTLFIAISLILMATLLLSACSGKEAKIKLSEMEDDQLLQTLTDLGVEFPKGVRTDGIREWIIELEEDPAHRTPFVSWTVIIDFYEDLRAAIIKYGQNIK